jgi:hypothetical protein
MEGIDPIASITMADDYQPHYYGTRRVGQPRVNWYKRTLDDFWGEARRTYPDILHAGPPTLANPQHVEYLRRLADKHDKHHFTNRPC